MVPIFPADHVPELRSPVIAVDEAEPVDPRPGPAESGVNGRPGLSQIAAVEIQLPNSRRCHRPHLFPSAGGGFIRGWIGAVHRYLLLLGAEHLSCETLLCFKLFRLPGGGASGGLLLSLNKSTQKSA